MSLREAFVPNGRISAQIRWALAAITLVAILGAWGMRPAFLPGPLDVLKAYPNLIDQGLFQELFTSLTTNLQAIGLSCLITLPLEYLTVVPAARPFVRALSKMRFL